MSARITFSTRLGGTAARRLRLALVSLIACCLTWCLALPAARAGTSNSLMDISADGRWLACSNRDSGTVSIIELESQQKRHELAVGDRPEGVTFVGDSSKLAVAVYGEDRVVLLDAVSGRREGQIDVFDEPYGLVSTSDGSRLYLTLDYPGQVLELDPQGLSVTRRFDVNRFSRGLTLAPAEGRLYVVQYYSADVSALDLKSGKVVDRWPGASTANLARQIALHPHRPKAYVPHIRSRVSVAHGEGSIFPILSVLDTGEGESRRKRFPMDSFRGNLVTANPWEVAISADGKQLAIIFGGTDEMFVCDVLDDNYREISLRSGGHVRLGHNPRAVRFAPDGETLYVYNALDFEVVALDTGTLRPQAKITVCDNPLGDEVLRGKRLFYSALQPMTGRRWIACSSCHPDGDPDGRTWQNPEGLRNTQALFGIAQTHPIHWSADRDEVQDFEHTIRGKLMQGRGLIDGAVHDSLGEPNAGRSADLDALAAYTNSHKFSLSPYAKGGLSEQARRGRELFFSQEIGCARCHGGPFYTDSRPGPPDTFRLHNVGTGEDDPSEKMGPAFDTPTLLGVYRTAPYLHHGTAATLEDVLTTCNPDDRHGKTSHLSPEQVADLVAFLKSLPYESPYENGDADKKVQPTN